MYKIEEAISMKDILATDNIATLITEQDLKKLANTLVTDYQQDKNNFETRKRKIQRYYDLALQIKSNRQLPFDEASDVIMPILTKAVLNFAATAYPSIIKDDQVVKIKVLGDDNQGEELKNAITGQAINDKTGKTLRINTGSKYQSGMRVANAMNTQLLCDMPEWENDTDLIMHILPVVGTCFRKIYYDHVNGKVKSEIVLPQFLLIDSDARCFDTANRITQILQLYPHQIQEYINAGIFINAANIDSETMINNLNDYYNNSDVVNNSISDDGARLFVEQHLRIDLDGDNYPEPYIVWMDESGQNIYRIVKRFTTEDIIYQDTQRASYLKQLFSKKQDKIKTIKEERYYVKYSFIPNPESPIYDLGYGDLLDQLNCTVNTTYNLMIDAGHKQVMNGGLISRELRMKGGTQKIKAFQWTPVDTPIGMQLRDALLPLPTPELNPVLFQLMQDAKQQAEQISVVNKVALGEIPANTPATTILAMIDQSSIQFKAIFKRIHRSLKAEFKRIFELDKRYLTDEEYNQYLSSNGEYTVQDDFNIGHYTLVPCSDLDCLNNTQQLIKAQILDAYKDDPLMNGLEIRKYILDAIGIKDIEKFIVEPQPSQQPQPDPIALAQAKALDAQAQKLLNDAQVDNQKLMLEQEKLMIEKIKAQTSGIKNLADAESKSSASEINKFQTVAQQLTNVMNNE